MASEAQISILVQLRDEASAALGKFGDKINELQPTFTKMAAGGAVAFGALSAVAVTAFKAYTDAEAQTEITNQSLQNTLDSMSKQTLTNLQKELGTTKSAFAGIANAAIAAGDAAVKLGFDDEEAARSFSKLFAVTKSVTSSQNELQIAMDLARYKNISLEEATQKLIMVHSGATKELKLLGLAVNDNASALDNLKSIQKQVTGSAETFAQTTKGSMQIIQVEMDNLKETIGGALEPAFAKLIEVVTPLLEKFADWASQNPDLIAKLILVGGALAGIVAVLGTIGLVLPTIIAGVSTLGTVFTILTGPIGLVVLAIGALVAAGVYLYNHWQEVEATLAQTWDNIKQKAIDVWNGLKDFFMQYWPLLLAVFTGGLSLVVGLVVKNWDTIKNTTKQTWDGIAGIISGVWEGIKTGIKDSINWILEKINSVIRAVNDAMAKVGGKIGISTPQIPTIPLLANGGIVTKPTLAVVGEAGPEAVVPLSRASSVGGLGGGIVININGGTYLSENAAGALGDMIIEQLRLNMRV